jgi:cardiolipin synthase
MLIFHKNSETIYFNVRNKHSSKTVLLFKLTELALLLLSDSMSPLTSANSVKLLINGEEKFPEVLKALQTAKRHIHIEYYIFEEGETGTAIEKSAD